MSEYYNMNRGLNYIKKHYNNSDQNELGEYVTELIDMIEVKDDIIEKKDEEIIKIKYHHSQRSREMIKRYWTEKGYLVPIDEEAFERNPFKEGRRGTIVYREQDIADSLIVWHDLRENPKDLPPLQCYVFVSDGENSHVAALLPEGWHFLGNVPTFKIIEWAYVPKSPKE